LSRATHSRYTHDELVATSRLFSTAVAKELVGTRGFPLLGRLIKQANLVLDLPSKSTLASVFEVALSRLQCEYQSDYVFREALWRSHSGRGKRTANTIVQEFRVGTKRADLVLLNGTSTAFEIKSNWDNLDRLDSQLHAFRPAFAKVVVVVGDEHLEGVRRQLPAEVGIARLTRRAGIKVVRRPGDCSSTVSARAVFNSVSMAEAHQILRHAGLVVPDVPNTERHAAYGRIFDDMPGHVAHRLMLSVLKETRRAELPATTSSIPAAIAPIVGRLRLGRQAIENLKNSMVLGLEAALGST